MGGGRPRSDVWKNFDGKKDAVCKRCKAPIVNAKVEKLERHILKKCPRWSAHERSAYIDAAAQRSRQSVFRASMDSTSSSSAGNEGSSSETAQMTQEEFNKFVANYIYTTPLPLRAVEKPGFQTFALKGRPAGLKVPSRPLVSGRLLIEAVAEEVELLVEDMKDVPFIVLVMDGCTSVSHWKMMNYMLYGQNMKPVVWRIVVTEENSQTAEYIAGVTVDVVKEVELRFGRVGFVTGVMSDNASTMQAACDILEKEHGLICAGCGAHTMNLLLQDIAKLPVVMEVMEKVLSLARFVTDRNLLRAKFEKERKALVERQSGDSFNQTLSLPVVTRWYSSYNCLTSVIKNKAVFTRVFQDSEFMASYKPKPPRATGKRKRRDVDPPKPSQYEVAERILKDDNFWAQGKQVMKLLAPIIKTIGLLETDGCSPSMVYWSFVDLLKKPVYVSPQFLGDTARDILECIEDRWKFLHTDAMGVAFLLDPTKDPAEFVEDDLQKSLNHVRVIAARLNYPKEQQDAAYREATIFVNAKWDAIKEGNDFSCNTAPVEWWGLRRTKYPALSELARRVLSMPTSSAAAERSWSTYKFIHNKYRNKLLSDRAMKLLFVYNCRLARSITPDAVYDQSNFEDSSAEEESGDEGEPFLGCDAERLQPEHLRVLLSGRRGESEGTSSPFEADNSLDYQGSQE